MNDQFYMRILVKFSIKLILTACLVFLAIPELMAQGKITVDATGEMHVPADIVNMRINIRVEKASPSSAYDEHKRQESFLASIIREHGLEGDKLSFQPMGISSFQSRDRQGYRTNQNVNLVLDDFSLYEEIQVLLIENGFENFSAQFGSTQSEEAAGEALDLAIQNAREKALRIAANVDKSLGDVVSIEHTAQPVGITRRFDAAMMAEASSGSMMQFEQTIPVSSSIRIVYHLE